MGNDGIIDLNGATKVTLKVGANSIEISAEGIKINGAKIEITGQGSWSGGNVFIN